MLEIIPVAIFVVLLLLYITVSGHLRESGKAIERVERKLDLILDHLDVEWPTADGISPEALAEIDRNIWSDRRIEAIKLYRDATGLGLVEAKQWVDRRAEQGPADRSS
ncbi:ribosomal protein L7/L12 [Promicromonospora sp. MEB111]|uniref:ribosomal protein L7/L12 n=1 Tax=unclassified Promicromonospora TaxID=2647929 RepID=UPI00254A5B51|nr:ribosomal protein L7/L12 [Promicromonospora sp. MEB111]